MTTELDADAAPPSLEASIRGRVDALAVGPIDLAALAAAGLGAVDVPVDRGGLGGSFADLVAALHALAELDPALASGALLGHFAEALELSSAAPILLVAPPLPWVASGLASADRLSTEIDRVFGAAQPAKVIVALDAESGPALHAIEPTLITAREAGTRPFVWASSARFESSPLGPALALGSDAARLARRFGVLVAAEAVAFADRALALADGAALDPAERGSSASPARGEGPRSRLCRSGEGRRVPPLSKNSQLDEFRRADMGTRADAARLLASRAAAEASADDLEAQALVVEALLFTVKAATENTLAASLAIGAASPARLDEALALHAEALRLRAMVARDDALRAALSLRLASMGKRGWR